MPGLYSKLRTEADGNILTAANYNAEHDNHITNQTCQMTDDYSVNTTQMRSTSDPGESGTESLATSLSGELERLRFAIKDSKGTTYWYETPATTLAAIPGLITAGDAANEKEPGWISNLGISYAAGTLTVTAADGTALSASNVGKVCVPSTTAGRHVVLSVTAPASFNDDAHASSDLTNFGFGVTKTAHWAEDMPYFLYVVNKANSNLGGVDGNSMFFIARSPCMSTTPTNTPTFFEYIADTASGPPLTDVQGAIMILGDVTVADYQTLPCQVIGAFRMRWSTTTDDWTVQALGNTDGVGRNQLKKTFSKLWTFPRGQNGASANTYLLPNGGTAPVFSTNFYYYKINDEGQVTAHCTCTGDGGTDGSGAVTAVLALPYAQNDSIYTTFGGEILAQGIDTTPRYVSAQVSTGHSASLYYIGGAAGDVTALQNANFSAGDRTLRFTIHYMAY